MATNLRLSPALETELRNEAERTGRSQQELIREALDRYLAQSGSHRPVAAAPLERLVNLGLVRPPRTSGRRSKPRLQLLPGVDSLSLLDRDDRV